MMFVSLKDGKVVLSCNKEKQSFDIDCKATDVKSWMAEHPFNTVMCSSDVNHPEDCGLSEDFDINDFFKRVFE